MGGGSVPKGRVGRLRRVSFKCCVGVSQQEVGRWWVKSGCSVIEKQNSENMGGAGQASCGGLSPCCSAVTRPATSAALAIAAALQCSSLPHHYLPVVTWRLAVPISHAFT